MKNKDEKRIDIKKVLSIMLSISIISAIFVISCFASVENLETNQDYLYNSSNDTINISSSINLTTYKGSYKGNVLTSNNEIISINITFTQLNVATYGNGKITINFVGPGIIDLYKIYDNRVNINVDGIIKFTSVGDNTEINNYLINNVEIYTEMSMPYINTDNFLIFSINTVKTLINYMITNNVILIVIAIVLVSFAVGMLIRLSRKKF